MTLKKNLLLLVLTMFAVSDAGLAANTKITKPVDGPELKGPIVAPGEKVPLDDVQSNDPNADLAYGAYQRGYYLTALELALPRAGTGDPAAQTLIAEIYWNGYGVARDRKKAGEWYRFAAQGGNREAQFRYANILLRGKLVPEDKKTGEKLMRKAAKSGHVQANFNLGQIITAKRPTWAAYKRALPFYTKAAEAGLADAQYALANIYAEAKGVPTNDDKTALKWLRKAAAGGLDTAQAELGVWLANGRSGPNDPKNAFLWFRRAAAQGNVVAQNRLARMYMVGLGVRKDIIRGGAWHIVSRRAGFSDGDLDRSFQELAQIDKKRAIELANRLDGWK